MTQVFNIKDTVYIGRRNPLTANEGYFGNPFVIGPNGDREKVLELYRAYFYERIKTEYEFKRRVLDLRGKVLLCYCKPYDCHGDIIKEYLDSTEDPLWRGEVG